MRFLVTGAAGLLGTEVASVASAREHAVSALGRTELDVTDAAAVERVVSDLRPDVVVQCAAYTAVDGAAAEPRIAMAVNRDGTRYVAESAARIGARIVYVSTDYVFDGGQRLRPYRPDDATNPLSAYARTKLAGERAALGAGSGAIVARTSWLYGAARPNFLTSMLDKASRGETLRVVEDQVGGPSWARSVASTVVRLVEAGAEGVWHASDRGYCNRVELVREATRLAGLDADIEAVSAASFGGAAVRPDYSPLDVSATEAFLGTALPHWKESLERFMTEEMGPHESNE
jgi:dTDP-4-dehydrorhamnose reductase